MTLEPYQGQPDIQRLLDAFKRKKVDRVPNFEVLIEDTHVQKLLGRLAGNTLSFGGDPAKGVSEGEGARPMKPDDYIELCRIIGQDAIIVEAIWTPFRKRRPDGTVGGLIADRSIKNRADFQRLVVLPDGKRISRQRWCSSASTARPWTARGRASASASFSPLSSRHCTSS